MFGGSLVNNDFVVCYLVVMLGLGVIIYINCCIFVVDGFF